MAVLLAAMSATLSGSADFFGGLGARYGRALAVAFTAQVVGVAAVLSIGWAFSGEPTAEDMLWGAASGVSGGLGTFFLYRGIAVSRVGLVSPIAAVVTGGTPVLYGIATGERPSGLATAGLVLGLVAILLVSQSHQGEDKGDVTAGVLHGLATGIGFGGLLIFLSFTGDDPGIWPLLPNRAAGAVVLGIVGVVTAQELRPLRASWVPAAGAGVAATLGNGLFILATQEGLLSVVSVITAMFPAATVIWARIVFKERLIPIQLVGLALALVAVALIAAG